MHIRMNIAAAFICMLFSGCAPQHSGNAFYVSLDGADTNPGTESKPFATLERARIAIRRMKIKPGLPAGGITVYVRGGIYPVDETFELNEDDAGTSESPIVWRSYPGEKVQFIGGEVITGFEPVSDPDALSRIDEAYHDDIYQCDLRAQGITDYGEMTPSGQSNPNKMNVMELFFMGERMRLGRYPDEGWLTIADVPQTGGEMIYEGLDRDTSAVPAGRHYGRFTYSGDRPLRWKNTDDIWMFGYWMWDWAYEYQKVARIDTEKREVYPEPPYHSYGYYPGQRFYFYNILEEVDSPGEWYLDRERGMLYFYPPRPLDQGEAFVSMLEGRFLELNDTSHITIRGIIFEGNRGSAIRVAGGTGNTIAGCVIRNVGNDGVTIDGGTENGVKSCDIAYTGGRGITISGGDRKTLIPGNNYAENNHIHHFSAVYRTYNSAVTLSGVGNRMSHNYIHDAPHMAVGFGGNDHVIEYNELSHIAEETGDVGAIYTGRNWTMRGHIIRYNYLHDITGPDDIGGKHFHDAMGVYLDDSFSSAHVYGNVFKRISRAVMIGGGRDNTVENNLFIDCGPSIHIDSRSQGWAHRYQKPGGSHRMYEKLDEINHDEPPYSTKYPKLASMLDENPHLAAGNVIARNVSYGRWWMNINDGLDFSVVRVENNVIADSLVVSWDKATPGNPRNRVEYVNSNPEIRDELEQYGNLFLAENPGISNEEGGFRLDEDSPALRMGFKQIPFDKVGLYIDEYRASLPER